MAVIYDKNLEGFYYTLQDQKGDDNPFKVKLQIIKSQELVKLQDGLLQRGEDDSLSLKTGSFSVAMCKASIIGWSGMLDKDSKDVPCELDPAGRISESCLDMIPAGYFEEIAHVASMTSQDPASIQLYRDDE